VSDMEALGDMVSAEARKVRGDLSDLILSF
jgi:hypothetical protein